MHSIYKVAINNYFNSLKNRYGLSNITTKTNEKFLFLCMVISSRILLLTTPTSQ